MAEDSSLMNVWVDGWQQECCGEPWEVGARVCWTVVPPDSDYLSPVFSPDAPIAVAWAEDHHVEPGAATATVEGNVVAISGVQLEYVPHAEGDTKVLLPLPGSARLTPLTRSNGSELAAEGFAGYVVTLET